MRKSPIVPENYVLNTHRDYASPSSHKKRLWKSIKPLFLKHHHCNRLHPTRWVQHGHTTGLLGTARTQSHTVGPRYLPFPYLQICLIAHSTNPIINAHGTFSATRGRAKRRIFEWLLRILSSAFLCLFSHRKQVVLVPYFSHSCAFCWFRWWKRPQASFCLVSLSTRRLLCLTENTSDSAVGCNGNVNGPRIRRK